MKTKLITAISLLSLGAVSHASAADVIVHRHVMPAIIMQPAPAFSWTGPYAGVEGAYQWGKHRVYLGGAKASDFSQNLDGAGAGLFAGFNSNMLSGAVLGIETDLMWNKLNGEFGYTGSGRTTDDVKTLVNDVKEKWSGATRIRLGFAHDRILPYIAGGVAYSNIVTNAILTRAGTGATPPVLNINNHSETMLGWTAGVGIDCAVADNLFMRLEYRYNDYGKKTIPYSEAQTPPTFRYDLRHRSQNAILGIAYRF